MADEDFTEREREQLISRARALSLTITRASEELSGIMEALKGKPAPKKRDIDEFGDPTFRFEKKVPIPKDIKLTRKMRDYAISKGFNASSIQPMWEAFTNYYQRAGTKWQDWYAVWQKWVRTESERRVTGTSTRDMPEL